RRQTEAMSMTPTTSQDTACPAIETFVPGSSAGHSKESGKPKICILLAEDGVDNQQIFSLYLRSAGAEVLIAPNGRIAVERAMSHWPDLILMDMQMPEMDGYAATAQ